MHLPFLTPQNFGSSVQTLPSPQVTNWLQNSNAQNYLNKLLAAARSDSNAQTLSLFTLPPQNLALANQQLQTYPFTPPSTVQSTFSAFSAPNTFNKRISAINNVETGNFFITKYCLFYNFRAIIKPTNYCN